MSSFSLLPPEIAFIVFQDACNGDGGTTALSLASVSRSFYVSALPLIYRVVAVHDLTRVQMLVEHFERDPKHATYVQHIFVAERSSRLDCATFESALKALWALVSPTVQSLTLHVRSRDINVHKIFQTVFDVSFPCLTDLVLCGDHPIPGMTLSMPSLKRFHTAGLSKRNAAGCFAPLSVSCPKLSHIRISMSSENNITYAISAAFDLPDAPTDISRMCLDPIPIPTPDSEAAATYTPFPTLPTKLVSLVVKPAPPPMTLFARATSMFYNQYLKQLDALVPACPKGRFLLLPAFKRSMWDVESYDADIAKKDWVDCMRGGCGAWSAKDAKSP